jgi:hypothetical protein
MPDDLGYQHDLPNYNLWGGERSRRDRRNPHDHDDHFSNRQADDVSSQIIGQGPALRVAPQSLTDHPRLHEGVFAGWKILWLVTQS